MTEAQPPASTTADWAPAKAAAAQHRSRRLQHNPRSQQRSQRLRTIAAVLWVIALILEIVGLAKPGPVGDVLALIGYVVLFGYAAVAFVWANSSGRFLLRGSTSSIRSALPLGAWPVVRRQLRGRSKVNPEHQAVIVELAHQQRRLAEGMLVFAGFYIVLYVGIAHSNFSWLRYGILLLGAVLLIWGFIAGIAGYRRLGRLTESDAHLAGHGHLQSEPAAHTARVATSRLISLVPGRSEQSPTCPPRDR